MEEQLKILLLGNGGREHALAWKLSQSPNVESIYIAPGNGGTTTLSQTSRKITNIPDLHIDGVPSFAKSHGVNLVVPGPEAPIVAGIKSICQSAGLRCFGPSAKAAQMEGSKAFAKAFMSKHGIPTAAYQTFRDTQFDEALTFVNQMPSERIVIKASGLAAGKGVIIPETKDQAEAVLKNVTLNKEFGSAGDEVVIEEFLEGEELSILSFSDGYTIRSLPPAQDHKQIYDGDRGPMTGGMGCYSPTRIATKELVDEIHRTILQPTINGMRRDGFPFVGMLFTGLMITKSGPKVLEYNVRFGDPETQTLLPLLSPETDLAKIILACTDGYLDAIEISLTNKFSATVVAVAGGYPGKYAKGEEITLSGNLPTDSFLFHAGTNFDISSGKLTTSGGRVIASNATGSTLQEAVNRAYQALESITFKDMFFRRDIAHRNLSASPVSPSHPGTLPTKQSLTYSTSGVSITAGNDLVTLIKPLVASTAVPGTDASIGGFGGLFSLSKAGYTTPPTLIGAIDGVGTKLFLAHAMHKHNTVGIDLVAMNANDLVVQGAAPLFFLDCYTCGKLDVQVAAAFVDGVARGCVEAGCALIGGETAEMPGLFVQGLSESVRKSSNLTAGEDPEAYDAVGAAVGAVAHGGKILPVKEEMRAGDILLGLASSGIHSNGFSLVRKILDRSGLTVSDIAPWVEGGATRIGDVLLTPTRIYVKPLLAVLERFNQPATAAGNEIGVKGLAHITGGGLLENIPRALPKGLAARMDARKWKLPGVFAWLKKEGLVEEREMARVWNCGIGMVVVVDRLVAAGVKEVLEKQGETVWEIGELVERTGDALKDGCVVDGMEEAWKA
jgi:phosphoribosylamine--glycine ligase / phosphoribosylformylglycinamidine cyclo-ligase